MAEEEEYSSVAQDVRNKFQNWFENLIPADLPLHVEADQSNQEIQRSHVYNLPNPLDIHVYNSPNLLELLFNFCFWGAVYIGAGVCLFVVVLRMLGLYSNGWPDPIFVILGAVVIGLIGGLFMGFLFMMGIRKENR